MRSKKYSPYTRSGGHTCNSRTKEEHEFEASLVGILRPCLKKKKLNYDVNLIYFWPGEVVQASNLSYSEGKDQKDQGSKPVQAKSLQDPSQPMAGHSGMHLSSQPSSSIKKHK
jgi:hypothetical protein